MERSRVILKGEQPDYIHAVTANVGILSDCSISVGIKLFSLNTCRDTSSRRHTSLLRILSSLQIEPSGKLLLTGSVEWW